jgi:hypothetical protein
MGNNYWPPNTRYPSSHNLNSVLVLKVGGKIYSSSSSLDCSPCPPSSSSESSSPVFFFPPSSSVLSSSSLLFVGFLLIFLPDCPIFAQKWGEGFLGEVLIVEELVIRFAANGDQRFVIARETGDWWGLAFFVFALVQIQILLDFLQDSQFQLANSFLAASLPNCNHYLRKTFLSVWTPSSPLD